MELIGKQIAIETILGQPPELHYPSWYAAQIEKLPPAPPEYLAEQAGILVTDTDTISRQAAIEALRAMQTYKLFAGDDMLLIDQAGAQTELMMLPPAQPEPLQPWEVLAAQAVLSQPEIIRCKDCRYFKQVFAPNDNDGLCGHWHSRCDARTSREGYCSHAERKEVTT